MDFHDKLRICWRSSNSLLCVGLDGDREKLPRILKTREQSIFHFNKAIIDATADFCCAYKPQMACYAAYGAEPELEKTIDYIKSQHPDKIVILDAKLGDIDATAKMYAKAAFDRYDADAVTINPYMGGDTLPPFLCRRDRGVIILCKTSNPGSGDIQNLADGGREIFLHIAAMAAEKWNTNNNVGLVVGATYPETIRQVRSVVGEMPLLIPGAGAQGGDLGAVMANGLTKNSTGMMINVSRQIIYAGGGSDFAAAAAGEAQKLNRSINAFRNNFQCS